MIVAKNKMLAVFLVVARAGLGQAGSAQDPVRVRINGDIAYFNHFENTSTGSQQNYVSVNRNESNGASETYLTYSTLVYDSTTGSSVQHYGNGYVPSDSLIVDAARKHYALNLDVKTIAGLNTYDYVCDSTGCTYNSPTAVSDGVISVTWEKTVEGFYQYEGHMQQQTGELLVHTAGHISYQSCTLSGSVLGESIGTGVTAYAGLARNSSIEVSRGH